MGENQPDRDLRINKKQGKKSGYFTLVTAVPFPYTHIKDSVLSTLQVRSERPRGIVLIRDFFRGIVSQPAVEWDA